jgi:hypothetical protein
LASGNERLEIAQCLIKNGADVNAINKWEETALNFASVRVH